MPQNPSSRTIDMTALIVAVLLLGCAAIVAYDASEAALVLGKASRDIETVLGYPGRAEMIHRDDMALGLG